MTTLISQILPSSISAQPSGDSFSGTDDGSFSNKLDLAKSNTNDSASLNQPNSTDPTPVDKTTDGTKSDPSKTDAAASGSANSSTPANSDSQKTQKTNPAGQGTKNGSSSNSRDRSAASNDSNTTQSASTKTSKSSTAEQPTNDTPGSENAIPGKSPTGKAKATQNPSSDPTAQQTALAQAIATSTANPQPVANAPATSTADGAAISKLDGVHSEEDLSAESPLTPHTKGESGAFSMVYGTTKVGTDPATGDPDGLAADSALTSSAGAHSTGKSDAQHTSLDPMLFDIAPPGTTPSPHASHATVALPVAQTPDTQFSEANHPAIVSTIRGGLLPNGGTMSIRLDPPELGAMQVTVKIEGGVVSASFETSNEQATRLLTHTLSQLKTALESQGVTVDRLHVHQSSKPDSGNSSGDNDNSGKQSASDQRSAQQEQQRKEMLRRMWQRVSGDKDPLDMVA